MKKSQTLQFAQGEWPKSPTADAKLSLAEKTTTGFCGHQHKGAHPIPGGSTANRKQAHTEATLDLQNILLAATDD
jgi:hypothetical protein